LLLGCNHWQAKDLGFFSEEALIGKYIYDIHSNAESVMIISNNEYILRKSKPQIFEECASLCDGQILLFSSYKFPLKNEKNKTIGVMGISVPLEQIPQEALDQKNADPTGNGSPGFGAIARHHRQKRNFWSDLLNRSTILHYSTPKSPPTVRSAPRY
jgi:hypothetical protein